MALYKYLYREPIEIEMIIGQTVKVKISSGNFRHFSELGYLLRKLERQNTNAQVLDVKIEHLKAGSNVRVNCVCDKCGSNFDKRIYQRTDFCNHCRTVITGKSNVNGKGNKGNKLPSMQGENHPRWNPNKSEKRKYTHECNKVTAQFDLSVLENSDKLRGLCGVDGAYQLDHIIPIQYGFDNNIPPEIIGHIDNLQFIPWEENNAKRDKLIKEIPNGINRSD